MVRVAILVETSSASSSGFVLAADDLGGEPRLVKRPLWYGTTLLLWISRMRGVTVWRLWSTSAWRGRRSKFGVTANTFWYCGVPTLELLLTISNIHGWMDLPHVHERCLAFFLPKKTDPLLRYRQSFNITAVIE